MLPKRHSMIKNGMVNNKIQRNQFEKSGRLILHPLRQQRQRLMFQK